VHDWDVAAADALHDCKQTLEERDVVRWLREATRAMWRPNAERYEPSYLFDTPRGVAAVSWENLRERMLAEYRAAYLPWRARGVRVTVPHGSLQIEVGDLAVHVVKAPGVRIREPEWTRFFWDGSATRRAAAERNGWANALPPPPMEGQLAFDFEVLPAGGHPVFRQLFFVWAGDAMGLTAGWLGLPRLGRPRWLAVTPLWRDDVAERDTSANDVPRRPAGAAFSERRAPEPTVSLKRRQEETAR
jgi:hypothetical protein